MGFRVRPAGRSARLIVAAGLVGALAGVGLPGAPAGATVTSCAMSQFPGKVYSMSNLKVACTSASGGSPAITIHDFTNASWHSSAARVITAATTNGSAVVTAMSGAFSSAAGVAGDLNRSVSATSVPAQSDTGNSRTPFIKQVVSPTQIVLSKPATATATVAMTVTNSTGRIVYDAVFTNGSTALSSATANFSPSDVGEFVYATGLRPGTKIASRTSATQVVLTQAATASVLATANTKLQITDYGTAPARVLSGLTRTNLSKTVTAPTAVFQQNDRGVEVIGTGIPAGTYVDSVATDGKSIVMTKAATASAAGSAVVTIGKPTPSAPPNGEVMALLSSELNVNPLFVKGFDSCAENTPEGFAIPGKWYNPGSFPTTTLPSGMSGAIGEIVYTTGVVAFSAFVIGPKTDAATAAPHYDVAFVSIPVSAASCTGSPSATTWSFNTITAPQSAASLGVVRANGDVSGVTPSVSVTGKVVSGASTYTTTCTLTRQQSNPGFTCPAAPSLIGSTG